MRATVSTMTSYMLTFALLALLLILLLLVMLLLMRPLVRWVPLLLLVANSMAGAAVLAEIVPLTLLRMFTMLQQ